MQQFSTIATLLLILNAGILFAGEEMTGILFSDAISRSDAATLKEVVQEEFAKRSIGVGESEGDIVLVFTPIEKSALGSGDEVYRIQSSGREITIQAARLRGYIYGIGALLKMPEIYKAGEMSGMVDLTAAPEYELRGHQLGYRNTANSWDAWTPEQYDKYIRELVLLGSNAIEDIPFTEQAVHMVLPHEEMHRRISEICKKYDVDYWVWTPGPRELSSAMEASEGLDKFAALVAGLPALRSIFYPGGDPGNNHPRDIFPYLDEVAKIARAKFPNIEIWISLQGFDSAKTNYFLERINHDPPDWFVGLVHGPSSPPLAFERINLDANYKLRLYGDITHTIRCQYPTADWDQAFALTLGREPINPQPKLYSNIFHRDMPWTSGFISYSDGVHDDLNKIVWNQLAWDSNRAPHKIVRDYVTFFFGDVAVDKISDAILALEQNWQGPIELNGAIESTLQQWQILAEMYPELTLNWRWQSFLFRAYYDTYVRRKAMYDQELEYTTIAILENASEIGSDLAIKKANATLAEDSIFIRESSLRDSIMVMAERLFRSVGLQTSVPLYQASNYERGSVIDFVDRPLNNKWWYQDQFDTIRSMKDESKRLQAIKNLRTWSKPGKGNYYDNISAIGESPHVISRTDDAIDYAWWNDGLSRARLSSQLFQFAPVLEYSIDPKYEYVVRVAGYGDPLVKVNGVRLETTKYNSSLDGIKEFILPATLNTTGEITVTFDRPDESHLNWREYSRVSDVWIFKQKEIAH